MIQTRNVTNHLQATGAGAGAAQIHTVVRRVHGKKGEAANQHSPAQKQWKHGVVEAPSRCEPMHGAGYT